ncbi:MAG: UvrD-helicase domain-containing protein [Oscillospiraceae bacterium]
MSDKIYNDLKQNALKKYFERMNDRQQDAVFNINGPLLILAGAGSGKTTVLVNRIANMIFFGNAYNSSFVPPGLYSEDYKFLEDYSNGLVKDDERLKKVVSVDCVSPWNILAITFTNKAAGELKARLEAMLGESSEGIIAATFHSACVRILRREIERLGYHSNFTIYDSDDTQRLVKSCLEELEISEKMFPPRAVLSEISRNKDNMVTPEIFENLAAGDYRKLVISKIYRLYQTRLFKANAVDFDDIICLTVKLFDEFPDILEKYQNRYKYILVDEYQDTNQVQYRLVSMLSSKNENLCVVGDDDQSIYKFRGATIENILSFEEQFDNTRVIRLEQNYRSTQNILSVANVLIKNNRGRKGKELWTASGDGSRIIVFKAANESGEAGFVADTILENIRNDKKFNDHAVLYRMNAQSNAIERAFVSAGIPYKIIGGLKFYDRKEIKDILSYLAVINNPNDLLRLKRIINEPKRGIGAATLTLIEQITSDLGISPIEVLKNSASYAPLAKKSRTLIDIASMFSYLTKISQEKSLDELLDVLLSETGYAEMIKEQGEEGVARLENINELKSTMVTYTEQAEEPSLSGFLEEVALFTDIDNLDENADYAVMMTIHAAKGLEFPNVFIVGMEENIFPGTRSMESEEDIEEERRLAYVAITRAKDRLYISHAVERMLFGNLNRNRPSRFLKELPEEYLELNQQKTGWKTSSGTPSITPPTNMSLQAQLANMKKVEKASNSGVVFAVGERVSHNIFGEGTILSAVKMSNDTMLEVAFDTKGTKKIMANFAKIKKI